MIGVVSRIIETDHRDHARAVLESVDTDATETTLMVPTTATIRRRGHEASANSPFGRYVVAGAACQHGARG